MSDKKKMKIMYLNVNGFLGEQEKKYIYKSHEKKDIYEAREKIKNMNVKIFSEELAKEINSIENLDMNMIFLSEVDPYSKAAEIFINQMKNNNYEELWPYVGYSQYMKEDAKKRTYSCSMCLKKIGLDYTNEGNGFKDEGNYEDLDQLQFCKIISIPKENNKEVTVLIGIHWPVGFGEKGNEVGRIAEFILSLKRLLKFPKDKKINIILFGGTNANPDVNLEEALKNDDIDKIEAYMNNCIFEHLMNELGLHEVVPYGKSKEELYTYVRETRIDRVFTNMPKDKVTVDVDQTFLKEDEDKNRLSDHAALLITYEED